MRRAPRQKGRQEHTALFLILGPLPTLFATLRPVPLTYYRVNDMIQRLLSFDKQGEWNKRG